MASSADRAQKEQAHQFLEQFQKSQEAWTTTLAMLESSSADAAAKLFAVTTLKGKIVYDLHQVPRAQLPELRASIMRNLAIFHAGPKPIRLQLCVCLANLAIQMTEWKDVLKDVVNSLGSDPATLPCVLDFLRVLPEEVTHGRKIALTEHELTMRTAELIDDNAQQALELLVRYGTSSPAAAQNPQLLNCITSWIREIPLDAIINSPLLKIIIDGLSQEDPFEAAVECMSALIAETRDVDETLNSIMILYPQVINLQTKLAEAAQEEDSEKFKGIARIFAEAGESWVILIARLPTDFRALVEAILATAALDKDRDAISHTFKFWYDLKQYLTLEKYAEARNQCLDIYAKLVDIMIGHLEFPKPEGGDEKDLFEGDREQEEKFREFRHQMGDVLKDCCEVMGVTECLQKPYDLIQQWVQTYGAQATPNSVPEWQKLEAPLFAVRAMGRMVPPDESVMLPRLIPLIAGIPDHNKLRFQAVMALGRYTEWTAQHPDTLQMQLDYIMAAFDHSTKDVIRAAALSFKFFCNDCASLLVHYVGPLQQFYAKNLNKLPISSQEEITEGVASVVAKVPNDQLLPSLKLYLDPVMAHLIELAQQAKDEPDQKLIADKINLLTIFFEMVRPEIPPGQEHPAVKYCQEIFPTLANMITHFNASIPILERVCRCWRYMVLSYRTAMRPLLPDLATKLIEGFDKSRQGCFLWATASIVREFSQGVDNVDASLSNDVYQFYEQQAKTFLRILSDLPPEELPDLIEDYFRLAADMALYFPSESIMSQLMDTILLAACSSLTLLKEDPIIAVLHFLRDLLGYGRNLSPSSTFDSSRQEVPPQIRDRVKQLVMGAGSQLVQRIMTGMMYSFPEGCFADSSGVLLDLFELMPEQVANWVASTVAMLPQGSITPQESERFLNNIRQRIQTGDALLIVATTLPFTCGVSSLPSWYWQDLYRQDLYRQSLTLYTIQEVGILDPPYGRPSLTRAHSVGFSPRTNSLRSSTSITPQSSTRPRRYSQPIPPPTLAERIALGPQLNPWHTRNPHRLEGSGSVHDIHIARKEQRLKEAAHYEERLHQLRHERRKSSRQLDGSRSAGTSPNLSRTNSEKDLPKTSSLKSLAREIAPFEKSRLLGRQIFVGCSHWTVSTVMIEAFKDMKHGKSGSYESLALERTASQILHRMEDKDSEDSLESTRTRVLANARAIYGPNRCLDVISFAPTSSRKIGACIVEHNPSSRSYVHCCSAKEDSRLAALEHLLVITEDLLQRLMDAEGITSSGWLPCTPQSHHAALYGSAYGSAPGSTAGGTGPGSVASSVQASRRGSAQPQDLLIDYAHGSPQSMQSPQLPPPLHAAPSQTPFINDFNTPWSHHYIQKPKLPRGSSDTTFQTNSTPKPVIQSIPRTSSDIIQQPKPLPVGQSHGPGRGRVQWNLGSEG
ncbi:arm repeat-containing protein [Stemphylium lycopersici]|nr:arm repeat-containing protein [Stemphylium lycopersici]